MNSARRRAVIYTLVASGVQSPELIISQIGPEDFFFFCLISVAEENDVSYLTLFQMLFEKKVLDLPLRKDAFGILGISESKNPQLFGMS